MWLKTSHSLRNQLSMVITNLYSLNQKLIELKYNQKNLQNFQCFIDRKQNNIYKSKSISTNIPSPSTFSHKKMYHPIRYNKPIPTTPMSVHTTQRNQQYSTYNISYFVLSEQL